MQKKNVYDFYVFQIIERTGHFQLVSPRCLSFQLIILEHFP